MRIIILSIILISTYIVATPTTYNNTGLVTKLEKFSPTCSYYSSIAKKDLRIKSLCKKYEKNLNITLKLGYKIDKSTSGNSSLSEKYLAKILSLDELREQIIEKISIAKTKARESNDATYHEKLIRKDVVRLNKSDYKFIAKHRDVYKKASNQRYLKMLKDGRKELLSDQERNVLLQKEKEKAISDKIEECQYEMTVAGHSNHQNGKISQGRVTGSNKDGIGVITKEGAFLIKNAPYHATGRIKTPIYVRSRGETIVQPKIDLGNPHPSNNYHFYMTQVGLYNMVWNNSFGGRVLSLPDKRYILEYDSECLVANQTTTSSTTDIREKGCPEMTINMHSKKGSGKISYGEATSGIGCNNNVCNYYVKTDSATYFIVGVPNISLGRITSPIYVSSNGEEDWVRNINTKSALTPKMWSISSRNKKRAGVYQVAGEKALIVYYNDTCTK